MFEHRQSPALFGLGLIDAIPEAAILANVDADDMLTPDGISGRPSWTDGGRLGRFGWKAQVPTLEEFVRDAVTAELGMTLPYVEGLTFGKVHDNDDVPDPEFSAADAEALLFFMEQMAPPPRLEGASSDLAVLAEDTHKFEARYLDTLVGPYPVDVRTLRVRAHQRVQIA